LKGSKNVAAALFKVWEFGYDYEINVKVEFGEGEGKVLLDKIAERAEAYKLKERVIYKMIKEYIKRNRLQSTYCLYS